MNDLVALYRRGYSIDRIGWETRMSRSTIRRRLLAAGVTLRHPASRGVRCVDCPKRVLRGKRCTLHRKIRHAELNRLFNREKFGFRARLDT